jgi:hypothetical protein
MFSSPRKSAAMGLKAPFSELGGFNCGFQDSGKSGAMGENCLVLLVELTRIERATS